MLKTRFAQKKKKKAYSMIMFFNNLAITAKFYNAEIDYVLLEKFPHSIDIIFIVYDLYYEDFLLLVFK